MNKPLVHIGIWDGITFIPMLPRLIQINPALTIRQKGNRLLLSFGEFYECLHPGDSINIPENHDETEMD